MKRIRNCPTAPPKRKEPRVYKKGTMSHTQKLIAKIKIKGDEGHPWRRPAKYKKKVIPILIALLTLTTTCFAMEMDYGTEEVTMCKEHGIIEDVVTINFWEEDYLICGECILEFISNNSEEMGRLIKKAKRKL